MNNKITKKSYFIKRLKDCGYNVKRLAISFEKDDKRKWVVSIDEGVASVLVFALRDETFRLYDGGRYVDDRMLLLTDSVEVVIETLNDCGIVNKHVEYTAKV